MSKYTYWFRELIDSNKDWAEKLDYGKLYVAGFPVPTGFVVAPQVKQKVQKSIGIDDVSKVSPSRLPEDIRKAIVDYYFRLNIKYNPDQLTDETKALVNFGREANLVLVRAGSKALPNIRGTGELLEAVLKCLAASNEPVVIQKMITPEKAGVMYTSAGDNVKIEATYGFASPVVTKKVEPDVYELTASGTATNKRKGAKQFAMTTDPETRTIERTQIAKERRETYVLHQREIEVIGKLAKKLEEHTGKPQKAIWAIEGRRVYLLDTETYQSSSSGFDSSFSFSDKPAPKTDKQSPYYDSPATEKVGSLATPARTSSPTQTQRSKPAPSSDASSTFSTPSKSRPKASFSTPPSETDSSESDDFFSDDWKDFEDDSPKKSHAAKESDSDTDSGTDSDTDSDMFSDFAGSSDFFSDDKSSAPKKEAPKSEPSWKKSEPESKQDWKKPKPRGEPSWKSPGPAFDKKPGPSASSSTPTSPVSRPRAPGSTISKTASDPQDSISWSTPQSASAKKDDFGFGSDSGSSSSSFGATKSGAIVSDASSAKAASSDAVSAALVSIDDVLAKARLQSPGSSEHLARAIYQLVSQIQGKEVVVKLSDAKANSGLLGARGIRRLGTQELDMELSALGKIATRRPNIKLALPFVTSTEEVRKAKQSLARHGLKTSNVGVAVETPAAVSIVDELAEIASFVLIDIDSLAELMLAVDRSDSKVSHIFDAKHKAVFNAVKGALKLCKGKNTPVYVCGTAATHSDFKQLLEDKGADIIFSDANSFKSDAGSNFDFDW